MKNKSHFKQYLITGLLSIVPIYSTYWILKQLFLLFSSPGTKLYYTFFGNTKIKYFPELLGFVLTIFTIYLIGLLITNILGRQLLHKIEELLAKIPFVSIVYKTVKQITQSLSSPNRSAFKKVVKIQYPRKGLWTLTMVTGESIDKDGNEYYHIFVPTTPNPTSGFMLYARKDDVIDTSLSVEEGLKIIISGGMLASSENEISF